MSCRCLLNKTWQRYTTNTIRQERKPQHQHRAARASEIKVGNNKPSAAFRQRGSQPATFNYAPGPVAYAANTMESEQSKMRSVRVDKQQQGQRGAAAERAAVIVRASHIKMQSEAQSDANMQRRRGYFIINSCEIYSLRSDFHQEYISVQRERERDRVLWPA